ncbi:MAG: CocE/NonD family hydrolase [Calditrichaeota bacterium]|nr:CocE/NonD family hydrolase [Calditrichota bacterium]
MRLIIVFLLSFLFYQSVFCQEEPFVVKEHYLKKEVYIPMRDGKRLFTSIYLHTTRDYPILMQRTPYSVYPYGENKYKRRLGPSGRFEREGFIFVYQDVRGRFMSEGEYKNMRPYIPNKTGNQTDETTDTYDTIDWLIKNIPHNNGRVGIWGISYPGFYTAMSLIDAHPALKAASPQAPIADWFIGDDVHHNGAFALTLAFDFFSTFGLPRPEPTNRWPKRFKHGTPDGYQFFLNLGALPNANEKYFHHNIAFWDSILAHETYDYFWKERNILPHLQKITPAVLVVGGWFDAEDLYGTLNIYKTIEEKNPQTFNSLVMGPWSHGGWERSKGNALGNVRFGANTSKFFQDSVLFPFFMYYLKGTPGYKPAEALCFDTGALKWKKFEKWAPEFRIKKIYLAPNGTLSMAAPQSAKEVYDEYISDPGKPVPFTAQITNTWGRTFMVEDQRFAARRPDVLVYQTPVLSDSVTLAGPLTAKLFVSVTGSDADFVVKLIDVYPDTASDFNPNPCKIRMGGYQQLIRAEIMRAKFRNSYSEPEPMIPGKITPITVKLQDIYHTFKPGHRIMVQIQSSWFPLFDRNPQKFVNIYRAKDEDFQKAVHRVYFSKKYPSHLALPVLKGL